MVSPEKPGFVATLNELAKIANVSLTTLANWQRYDGFPGQKDGMWCIWDIAFWRGQKEERDKPQRPTLPSDDDPLLNSGDSPGLERYRLAKAGLAELDLAEREKHCWTADAVHDGLMIISQTFRQASETIQRQFGPEAYAILEEAVREAEAQINDLFGPADDNDASSEGSASD